MDYKCRFYGLGIFALAGWGVLTYIVWDSIRKGGYYIATNLFGEMWIEAIFFPLIVVFTIVLMFAKGNEDDS